MNLKQPIESRHSPDRIVYTLQDLETWERPGTWLAVVGYPVTHSLSPPMHRAALRDITRKHPEYASWDYVRFEVPPEAFAEALPEFHKRGFYGLNLTLPHKIQALELIGEVDSESERMGAVNTLVGTGTGYRGYNTDGFGLRSGIYTDLDVHFRERHVVLLGAGGAARAAAVQCLKDGCRSLWIGNRTASRLVELIGAIDPEGREGRLHSFDLWDPPEALPQEVILINATSAGLKPEDSIPINLERFSSRTVVYDMIYNPSETRLMREARARGMRSANGLSMLVYQGARSLEIWTQVPAPVPVMETAAAEALRNQ